MSSVSPVAGMSTCYCEEHPGGHPIGEHDRRTTGFYSGDPATCLICGKMKALVAGYLQPRALHVHAYPLPDTVRPAVAEGQEEEEEEW